MVEGELTSNFHYFILTYLAKLHDTKAETIGTYLVLEEVLGLSVGEGNEPPGDEGDGPMEWTRQSSQIGMNSDLEELFSIENESRVSFKITLCISSVSHIWGSFIHD